LIVFWILCELEILKKTIVRYAKGVAFPALLRIEGNKIDAHKGALNDIYEKCCVCIDGHASPSSMHTAPTINELKADLDSFLKIRAHFT
jgi:hypothetical protein